MERTQAIKEWAYSITAKWRLSIVPAQGEPGKRYPSLDSLIRPSSFIECLNRECVKPAADAVNVREGQRARVRAIGQQNKNAFAI